MADLFKTKSHQCACHSSALDCLRHAFFSIAAFVLLSVFTLCSPVFPQRQTTWQASWPLTCLAFAWVAQGQCKDISISTQRPCANGQLPAYQQVAQTNGITAQNSLSCIAKQAVWQLQTARFTGLDAPVI